MSLKIIYFHNVLGFVWSRTASVILAAVQSALTLFQANHVTVVGHSLGDLFLHLLLVAYNSPIQLLGAALALLDGVYLSLHLPNVTLATITYGMPRVCFFYCHHYSSFLDSVP